MSVKPIIMSEDSVRAILAGKKSQPRKRLYVRKGQDPLSPEHLARRLLNGIEINRENNCWEWQRANNGYGYGTLTVAGKTTLAHRLMYELVNGEIATDLHVLHKCDNPACINPDHLQLGTQSDNMRDCYERGRAKIPTVSLSGERNGAAKLTHQQVAEIRNRLQQGERQHILAAEFGVCQSQISNIKRGLRWQKKSQ